MTTDTLSCPEHGHRRWWPTYWTHRTPACYACGQPVTTCGEWLADPDGYVARCIEPYGTEHSHHDHTAREAVAARRASEARARPSTVDPSHPAPRTSTAP